MSVDGNDNKSGYACQNCNDSNIKAMDVRSAFFHRDRLAVVDDIPALICANCGEQFYDDQTIVMLNLLRCEGFPAEKARECISVPVFLASRVHRERGVVMSTPVAKRHLALVLLLVAGVAPAKGQEDDSFMPKGARRNHDPRRQLSLEGEAPQLTAAEARSPNRRRSREASRSLQRHKVLQTTRGSLRAGSAKSDSSLSGFSA